MGYTFRILDKAGQVRWMYINAVRIEWQVRPAPLNSLDDVNAHCQAEEALRQGEERLRSLFENMLNGFAYCRMIYEGDEPVDFIYLDVKRSFKELTGLGEVVGRRATWRSPSGAWTCWPRCARRWTPARRPDQGRGWMTTRERWSSLRTMFRRSFLCRAMQPAVGA